MAEPAAADHDLVEDSPPGITIEFSAVPTLSYTAAHNHVPVLGPITVRNRGPE